MEIISGFDFNSKFTNIFYCITNTFRYRDHYYINNNFISRLEYNTTLFTIANIDNIFKYLNLGVFICQVTIPNDAIVHIYSDYFQVNKLILNTKYELREWFKLQSYDNLCKYIKINGNIIYYIDNQDIELCKIAIINNWKSFKYIKNKNILICLTILNINPYCIKYINNPSEYLCIYALRINSTCIKYIKNPSQTLIRFALDANPNNIKYVNQNFNNCLYALRNNIHVFQHINFFYN